MLKFISLLGACLLSASGAIAGAAVYVAPEVAIIEEPMRNGSGAWLIPLAIIAILALTLTKDSGKGPEVCELCEQ